MDYFDCLTWELNHEYIKIYLNVLFVVATLYTLNWICGKADLIIIVYTYK